MRINIFFRRNKIKRIIAEAILEAEAMKIEKDNYRKQNDLKERREAIGLKDFSHVKRPVWRWIRTKLNEIFCALRMPLIGIINKNKFQSDKATTELIRLALSLVFWTLWIASLLITVIEIILLAINIGSPDYIAKVIENYEKISVMLDIVLWSSPVVTYLLAGVFRLIYLEIEQTKSHEKLFSIFTAVVSTISMIVAIIALYKG